MKLIVQKPDTLGASASALCLVHCMATPFLFLAQATSACCSVNVPVWWQSVDVLFLVISWVAVYRSTRTTTKDFMKIALWLSWVLLFAVILIDIFDLVHIPEILHYTPALALVALHMYNLKYCQCKNDTCCATHG